MVRSENKNKTKNCNVPGFNDFHKEVPGVKRNESTIKWWLKYRLKLIKQDKFEELVNQYALDPSTAFLVEPPKAPEPSVAQTKRETEEGQPVLRTKFSVVFRRTYCEVSNLYLRC